MAAIIFAYKTYVLYVQVHVHVHTLVGVGSVCAVELDASSLI